MRVIAYTYDADVHCVSCAKERFKTGGCTSSTDDNAIPHNALDSDGYEIDIVFGTDEREFTHCGSCGDEL